MNVVVNIKMKLPDNVHKIITTLQNHGYEAYAVGGCVRDSILGRIPGDWDITTSAMPEETKVLFERTFDTGIEHGTITVLLDGEGYEVTTYRIDGEYEDNRHPKEVTFTRNLKEDLLRRDFTINAMAYNEKEGLIDIFGGIEDIQSKTIRCVGDAIARFSEDALRILRGIRFAAQLGFEIDESTRAGMKELAPTLKKISAVPKSFISARQPHNTAEYPINRIRLRLFIIRSIVEAPAYTKQTLLNSEGCTENFPITSQFLAP